MGLFYGGVTTILVDMFFRIKLFGKNEYTELNILQVITKKDCRTAKQKQQIGRM
jgi:hypothetical protein